MNTEDFSRLETQISTIENEVLAWTEDKNPYVSLLGLARLLRRSSLLMDEATQGPLSRGRAESGFVVRLDSVLTLLSDKVETVHAKCLARVESLRYPNAPWQELVAIDHMLVSTLRKEGETQESFISLVGEYRKLKILISTRGLGQSPISTLCEQAYTALRERAMQVHTVPFALQLRRIYNS